MDLENANAIPPPPPLPVPLAPPATQAMDTEAAALSSPRARDSDGAVDAITPALGRLMSKREFPGGERSALSVRWDANVQDDDEDFVVARECKRRDECKATPTAIRTLKAAGGGGARIIYSAAGLDHLTGEGHQESPKRLRVLLDALRESPDAPFTETTFRAPLSDVLRVHDFDYVKHLRETVAAAPAEAPKKATPGACLDSDTRVSPGSLEAALAGCGAALVAVDAVCGGKSRAVLVVARPPGHHAGPRGAVPTDAHFWKSPEMCSCGFCLLNTAAVAAGYARYAYGRDDSRGAPVRRVAIVDFDVHHGNGTEACVRNLAPRRARLPLPPSWPPQYYDAYAPWLDETDPAETFFGSVHLFAADGSFYPGSGSGDDDDENIVNVPLSPVGPCRPGDAPARHALGDKQRDACKAKASSEFRAAVVAKLLPKLAAFRPDLLIFSAGFDGHEKDLYHFLSDDDYAWFTTACLDATRGSALGRAVSILEGGYSVDPPPPKRGRRSNKNKDEPPPDLTGGLVDGATAHLKALAAFDP